MTAIIITYNEEKNIMDCIESIELIESINEVLLIDSNSTDRTIEIAEEHNAKVISTDITSITEKRKFALKEASNDWILFLDADERITDELSKEITALKPEMNENVAGYLISRKNFYLGKWIKHCGIYPDFHLRLFNKNKARITDRVIHEGVEVTGDIVRLQNDFLHYSVTGIEQMIDKINFYSTFEAQEHFNNKKSISKFGVFTHAVSAFLRVFISRKGFKDGLPGFYVSIMDSMVNFLTHLKLLKMYMSLRAKRGNPII